MTIHSVDVTTGERTTRTPTPAEVADYNRRAAQEQSQREARQQAERNLDTAPAVVRDVMKALILAGVLTAEQARTAYATAVEARQ